MLTRREAIVCAAGAVLAGCTGRSTGDQGAPRGRDRKMPEEGWVRAGTDGETRPVWGHRQGLQVALYPGSYESDDDGGPRGLLRLGYPILDGGRRPGLVNFIAVEPIVKGQRGFSELERSGTDGRRGRVFWAGPSDTPTATLDPGVLTGHGTRERLTVTVHTERFANGAQPIVTLEMQADRPDEVQLTVRSAPGSAAMETCVLTATMGNYERLRRLWLADGPVEPRSVWPGFAGNEFTDEAFFPVERLVRTHSGDVLVCATTDEKDPHAVPPDPAAPWWAYRGSFPVTQYWRKPKGTWSPALRVRVNGRRVYWASHNPIPGGLAYENFDLVEPFRERQVFVFGVTRRSPAEVAAG